MSNNKVKRKQLLKRVEIIESVLPLISTRSFEALSIIELCEAAGISTGTFYHYFNKKSDLLAGLVNIVDIYMAENVFDSMTAENELDNLKLFAHYWAVYVSENGVERARLISSIEPSATYLTGSKRLIYPALEEVFRRGCEKGQICTDYSPEEHTELFLLALRGVVYDWSRRGGNYPIIEKMDCFISLFLHGTRT